MKPKFWLSPLVVVLLAATIPYLIAALNGGQDWVFTGVLANPADGASYLAKVREGWEGAWRFTLPFTAQPGAGAYLFLYYLFLGHLARWLGLPIILIYHIARLAGAAALVYALSRFVTVIFPNRPDLGRIALWLMAVGSGMGWIILFLGPPPSDFWVAEAFPFLAMYTNPHFSLGVALLLLALGWVIDSGARARALKLLVVGLLISVVFQFALVVALVAAAAWVLWTWIETRRLDWLPIVSLGALGGPYLLYQFWAIQSDPVLAGWNAQNITPSPYLYDFVISFSPALLLALPGILGLERQAQHPARRLLISWFALGLLLIYVPFALQRRFMLGFYIPTAALAVYGIDFLRQRYVSLAKVLVPLTFSLALPTNILLIVIGLIGVLGHSSFLYLRADEARALAWIEQQTPSRALVVASPELARWIPGMTGRRVIYGHPYETVNAAREEQWVNTVYQQPGPVNLEMLESRKVDYVIYGPREKSLASKADFSALRLAFQDGQVQVYAVAKGP